MITDRDDNEADALMVENQRLRERLEACGAELQELRMQSITEMGEWQALGDRLRERLMALEVAKPCENLRLEVWQTKIDAKVKLLREICEEFGVKTGQ